MSLSHFSENRLIRALKKTMFSLVLGGFAATSTAQNEAVPFLIDIFGNPDIPEFRIYNQSWKPITKVKITIGDTSKNWFVYPQYTGLVGFKTPGVDYQWQDTGKRDDFTLADMSGFDPNTSIHFYMDIEGLHDFRTTMFNNGSKPNAKVTVYTADGDSEEIRLEDRYRWGSSFRFVSDARPPVVKVSSFAGEDLGGNKTYVRNSNVKVISDDSGTTNFYNIGQVKSIPVVPGNIVEVTAPQFVYMDASGNFLSDSTNPDAGKILQAKQRFEAIGISVNNNPETGDPTFYRFEVGSSGDLDIGVKWRHDYALEVDSDFTETSSDLKDESGTPWVGPVHSKALGNPEPSVKLHWIPKGELVTATVAGTVAEQSKQGLDVRYVPIGFDATGAAYAAEVSSRAANPALAADYSGLGPFVVGQSPPSRQQINQFTMDGPATITYKWKVQFGVTVAVDDASRSQVPLVIEYDDDDETIKKRHFGQGTFWFNPGTRVQVLCKANDETPEKKALGGWINGDGFYFLGNGEVNSPDGTLLQGASQAADWLPEVLVGPDSYRGYDIYKDRQNTGVTGLVRPVRALWTYGNQAIAVTVPIGQYVFQNTVTVGDESFDGTTFLEPPSMIRMIQVAGKNTSIAEADMTVWDPTAAKLYPLVPGMFRATWSPTADPDRLLDVIVTAVLPETPHYPHIADTPAVNLDPSDADTFIFKELKYTETEALVDEQNGFFSSKTGWSTLLFGEIQQQGRGQPAEYLRVRTVKTSEWKDVLNPTKQVIVGRQIKDAELDKANLETGHIVFPNARYNPFVYDASKLENLGYPDVYDIDALEATTREKVVVARGNLPGPVIPVNLHPGAVASERIVMVWYDDPTRNDNLLWPHASRLYEPRWPINEAEGLGRIVIASQFGSESLGSNGEDQLTAEAVTNLVDTADGVVANITPEETTFNPTRLQGAFVYNQPDRLMAGYNPNEEHALMAPSLRFARVSPRPDAAYALRNKDLNVYNRANTGEGGQPGDYTSHPYVLVQYLDVADETPKMKVYEIEAEDTNIGNYSFADSSVWNTTPTATRLRQEPYVKMEAGEPVIPFYPLGVVIGAVPTPETYGSNITSQVTYWEDHKSTSWAISGGDNAWFTQFPYYPLQPDFWWPNGKSGNLMTNDKDELIAREPQVGQSLAFLPSNIGALMNVSEGSTVGKSVQTANAPTEILYRSVWPDILPTLKAGETLTYSGGEYRADHPTSLTADENGDLQTVETPGLPGVLAFAVAEIAYDSLNPTGSDAYVLSGWSARVAQVLEKRTAALEFGDFPAALAPASTRTRVSQGKYVFTELPASLQKRFRYDPIGGYIEISGLVNDKDIADDTLTAPPPAVYALEPNIMTVSDRDALLALDSSSKWRDAVGRLFRRSRNPDGLMSTGVGDAKASIEKVSIQLDQIKAFEAAVRSFPFGFYRNYVHPWTPWMTSQLEALKRQVGDLENFYGVGLQSKVIRDSVTGLPKLVPIEPGSDVMVAKRDDGTPEPVRGFGPGLAVIPNAGFLDPTSGLPDYTYITLVENNDPSMGGSPVTLHVIKIDRGNRYRGSVKTILSDNVFDENIVLRHTGDFGANADDLFVEWWYRPDDGSLNVPPPDMIPPGTSNPWKIFPDLSGKLGQGQYEITLKGNPNAPEALLADTWWFARYRHKNDWVDGTDWSVQQPDLTQGVNFTWAGAGNSDPFNDFDLDGLMDFRAQLAMGWIKRVLDAVNPYEARIRDFEGENPSTVSSMIQQFGPRFEGPVALNPAKNVIENVGLIELYETLLKRGRDLSIDLSRPVSTPAIANALQLASTRISDFYTLLANEAYADAVNPTIGFGSDSVDYGHLAPAVFTFQNQMSSLLEEELGLMRGVDDYFARPVYNRLFWNFTKGEGEAAYAQNYNVSDINMDGFIDEDDAMILFPQGHGDAWGHYLTALRNQYDLLKHPFFNWVSRSEFYNLMDIVIKVDFLDERKFAETAAAKAKAGAEVVELTYREHYVSDPMAQWQGYTDSNPDRAWGVQGWARRAGQGAYFDWVTASALLPSEHPNETLEGIQKVDRASNSDIAVISANLNKIQLSFDHANKGYNPLGLDKDALVFDVETFLRERLEAGQRNLTHFDQIFERAVYTLKNAKATWDHANEIDNMVRAVATTEAEFRNAVYQEDLTYRNRLIEIFGRPYEGTIGSGKLYPAGYDGPDIALHMYVDVREITDDTVPGPTADFAGFDNNGKLNKGAIYDAFTKDDYGKRAMTLPNEWRHLFAGTLEADKGNDSNAEVKSGWYSLEYTDLVEPKVPLDGLTDLMPVTTAGYTFQAPDAWGNRLANGELQSLLNQMIQQEANIVQAIAAWDDLTGTIVRTIRIVDARIMFGDEMQLKNEVFSRIKLGIEGTINGLQAASALIQALTATTKKISDAGAEAVPLNLPFGGFTVGPGDALAPLRAGMKVVEVSAFTGFTAADAVLAAVEAGFEIALSAAENELELWEGREQLKLEKKEWLKEIEDLLGDEPPLRIAIFREIETLRELSDRYRAKLDEGSRLIDERTAYNKRVAAKTQMNRYQDMTFRVTRNHALESYKAAFDIAARYVYLAARTYDYETNFDPSDPASPIPLMDEIMRARNIGLFDDEPRLGGGGLSEILATLRENYDVVANQLGVQNLQFEAGKISLREELFRILPKGSQQPSGVDGFASPGGDSDQLWKETLQHAMVDDLWSVSEFRELCRPFAAQVDDDGNHIAQPALVIRFGTDITSGNNVFGLPLAGGDHFYDPTVFSTKIDAAGVWFSDYRADDILNDMAETPRIYLIPAGMDIMSVPTSADPGVTREWDVVEQRIPVPMPVVGSDLDAADWIPLHDSLDGRYRERRRFSSFRAYHNSSDIVDEAEVDTDTRLFGRSVWNTQWLMIIPGASLHADPEEGLRRFIEQVSDINLVFETYGVSGN